MNLRATVYFTVFIACLTGCASGDTAVLSTCLPLIPKDTADMNERNNKLFVFVGEKISISPIPRKPTGFDDAIVARYKVIERVYGDYCGENIEFMAFDHFGRFAFANTTHALLFLSKDSGQFYHEKYIYEPIFKTKEGRWAGPYSDEYQHPDNEGTPIKPEKIEFAENVSFPTSFTDELGGVHKISYPEPYYKTVNDQVVAEYGNYVKELFELNKNGVLTARELFSRKNKQ